jgi:hypothetical protein
MNLFCACILFLQEGTILTEDLIRETEEFVLRTGRYICDSHVCCFLYYFQIV